MRLTDDQILELTTHTEPEVRQLALQRILSASFHHPGAFDAICRGYHEYGDSEEYQYIVLNNLRIPAERIPAVIAELEFHRQQYGDCEGNDGQFNWLEELSSILAWAEMPDLPAYAEDLSRRGLLLDDDRFNLSDRCRLLECTAAEAWELLTNWARDRFDEGDWEDGAYEFEPRSWTEVLVRKADAMDRQRILEHLQRAAANGLEEHEKLLTHHLIRAAAKLRLDDALPSVAAVFCDLEGPLDACNEYFSTQPPAQVIAAIRSWVAPPDETTASDSAEEHLNTEEMSLQRLMFALEALTGPEKIAAAEEFMRVTREDNAVNVWPVSSAIVGICNEFDAAALPEAAARGQRLIFFPDIARSLLGAAIPLGMYAEKYEAWREAAETAAEMLSDLLEEEHEHDGCGPGCSHDHHDGGSWTDDDGDDDSWLHGDAEDEDDEPLEVSATQATVRNDHSHVGRNEPCPCGSGKKFKKCCLRTLPGVIDE